MGVLLGMHHAMETGKSSGRVGLCLCAPLPTCVYLCLQFNDNQLDSWEDLDQFKTCIKLQTVYLERNPIWKDTAYRRKVKLYLPNVTQIDATLCG